MSLLRPLMVVCAARVSGTSMLALVVRARTSIRCLARVMMVGSLLVVVLIGGMDDVGVWLKVYGDIW